MNNIRKTVETISDYLDYCFDSGLDNVEDKCGSAEDTMYDIVTILEQNSIYTTEDLKNALDKLDKIRTILEVYYD